MKGKKQIRICALMAALLLFIMGTILPITVWAAATPTPPKTDGGHAVVLYDKTHERYLVEQNGADMLNTSTSAKVMTGLLVCELLAERQEETVTVTEAMLASVSGYSMHLEAGEKIKIRDLLYGAICGSYNDAAYVLSHLCAGSTEGFVALMNEKALSLGAKATTYVNPLGYPDSAGMITTAYDTLKIALAASDNELYMEICSARKHEIAATNKSDSRLFHNRNFLVSSETSALYYNKTCMGMNAGYSGEAGGWSIVTLSRDDGADYICVLLGGRESEDESINYAYQTVSRLIEWVCKTYNAHTLYSEGAQLGVTKVELTGFGTEAPYLAASALTVYAPSGAELHSQITLQEDIKAPIDAGTVIGKLTVTYDGQLAGECDLVLKESYEVNTVMLVIDKIGSYTQSRAFVATVVFFVAGLLVILLRRRAGRGLGRRRKRR